MKAVLKILASFIMQSISRCMYYSFPGWRHQSFEKSIGNYFSRFLNHRQHNIILNTAISIVVAKSGHHCFEIAAVDDITIVHQ